MKVVNVSTTITGYTTTPIELTGYYSQTYRPEHHNVTEHFLFEPRLEPGISQTILDELEAKNIRLIHMYLKGNRDTHTCNGDITGDLDRSNRVSFTDFAKFATRWQDTNCGSCDGADLTSDGNVNEDDLAEFSRHWLDSAITTYGFDGAQ